MLISLRRSANWGPWSRKNFWPARIRRWCATRSRRASLEGYLFQVRTASTGIRRSTDLPHDDGRIPREWKALGAGSSIHATITLASLVEREARRLRTADGCIGIS